MQSLSLNDIKKEDDVLYTRVLEKKEDLKAPGVPSLEDSELLTRVDALIMSIEAASEIVESSKEYQWLSQAAMRWHAVFSNILESPRVIRLVEPKKEWFLEPSSFMSDREIEDMVQAYNKFTLYAQTIKNELIDDKNAYESAKMFFVSEVLDGRVNMASRISPGSYWRLEEQWVDDIKRLRAYFIWEPTHKYFDRAEESEDFKQATEDLLKILVNKDIKARISEFSVAKAYIQDAYLTDDGNIMKAKPELIEDLIKTEAWRVHQVTGYADEVSWRIANNHIKHCCVGSRWSMACKLKGSDVDRERLVRERANSIFKLSCCGDNDANYRLASLYIDECNTEQQVVIPDLNMNITWLIRDKAQQIYTRTGSVDEKHNWLLAEKYVRMYYENIIPAIERRDKEKTLRVLKAFQFSKKNHLLIKNCFELALAIYFLDPGLINELWTESERYSIQVSDVESVVELNRGWPESIVIAQHIKKRFWCSDNRRAIYYYGVMLPEEKDEILAAVRAAVSRDVKEEYAVAVEKLYLQSRLIHRETTL